jgi:hypothetical protein
MPKFRITFGLYNVDMTKEVIEVESLEKAQEAAYESAMEVVDTWLSYGAEEISDEEASDE